MWAIIWREAAKTDLGEIVRHIGQFSPASAECIWQRI